MRTRVFSTLVLLTLLVLPVAAQHRDFPMQSPKDPMTTEVTGIAAYHLVREGEIVKAEAFDSNEALLASCTAEWSQEATTLSCVFPDGQELQATWFPRHVEFEDLTTGEHFSLHFEGRSARLSESAAVGVHEAARKGWSVRGGKTWEELDRDWGKLTPIFAYLKNEIQITLNGAPAPRLNVRPHLRLETEPDALMLCPDGELFCNSSRKCDEGDLGSTPSSCCTKVSILADACCERQSGLPCCANSICQYICPFGLYCDCFLDGWQFDCQPDCV